MINRLYILVLPFLVFGKEISLSAILKLIIEETSFYFYNFRNGIEG